MEIVSKSMLWIRKVSRAGVWGAMVTLGVLILAGCGSSEVNYPAPKWSLLDLKGKAVSSSDFDGKVVVLNFWATWCPPCRKEIPGFIELQNQYGADGLAIVGVAYDQEGAQVVRPFAEKAGINYTVLLGTSDMADQFGGIEGFPTTFIINREGQVVRRFLGYRPKKAFAKVLGPLVKP